ncbi:MAG: energy transducer TonB [Verrucomicrobiota bacterium]
MRDNKQAFIASTVLHIVALGVVAGFILVKPKEPEQPVVLELVVLPEENDTPTPPTPEPVTEFTPPQIEEVQPRKLPDVNIPEPEPEPPPPEPEPEPELVEETPPPPPEPKPEPKKPEPKPEKPKVQKMDINQFRKKHGLPDQVKRTQPKPQVTTHKIDTSKINQDLQKVQTLSYTSSAKASTPQIAAYEKRLVQAIELRWNKPTAGSGDEWAQVKFTVAANGTISNIRVLKSQGPASFVASIKAAIQSTSSIGPRPKGWNGEMTIIFRLE